MGQCDICQVIITNKKLVKIQKGNGITKYLCESCYDQNVSGPLRYLRITTDHPNSQAKLPIKKE